MSKYFKTGLKILIIHLISAYCLVGLANDPLQKTVLVLGDSLSAEYGIQRGMGWVALLDKQLNTIASKTYKIVNASISGETTAGGVQRIIPLIEQNKPRAKEVIIKFFSKNKNNDNIMIINKVCSKLIELVCKEDVKPTQDLLDKLKILINFFNKIIFRLGTDYIDIQPEINGDNYILDDIFNIMKHIITNTMMVNYYNILQQIIKNKLMILNPYKEPEKKTTYNKKIDKLLRDIITNSVNRQTNLLDFIFDTMPSNILKISLEVYEDDNEKDKLKLQDQFIYVEQLLKANPTMATLNIKDDLAKINKYFTEYFTENCKQMKNIVDGFIHCLMNLTEAMNITVDVVEKAIKELDIIKSK